VSRPVDGDGVRCAGRNFTVIVDHNEDGTSSWYECDDCETAIFGGDDSLAAHECFECPGCHEWFEELTAEDVGNPHGTRYCTEDCLSDASERFWMAVYSA
jgi:hypothetical protein